MKLGPATMTALAEVCQIMYGRMQNGCLPCDQEVSTELFQRLKAEKGAGDVRELTITLVDGLHKGHRCSVFTRGSRSPMP